MNIRNLICYVAFSVTLASTVSFSQVTPTETSKPDPNEKTYLGIGYMLTNYGVMVLEVAEGSYAEGVLQPGGLITKIGDLTTGTHISRKIMVTNEQVQSALKQTCEIRITQPARIRQSYDVSLNRN